MISPELKNALARAVRGGQPLVHAAKALGVPRSSLYAERARDPAFAAQLDEARRPRAPEPTPDHGTVEDRGADAAGRLVRGLSRAQKTVLRDALLKIRDMPPDPPTPAEIAGAALKNWLAGTSWADIDSELDADELRRLSQRAADDYDRWRMLREAERATHGGDDGAQSET